MSEDTRRADSLETRMREIMDGAIQTAERLRDQACADRLAAADVRQQINELHAAWQDAARRQALDRRHEMRVDIMEQLSELVLSRLAQRGRPPNELQRFHQILRAPEDR